MILYHGSDSNFRKLRISKSLTKHDSTINCEGLGIYVSTHDFVASQYGKYLYTLEVRDDCLRDFREYEACQQYLYNLRDRIIEATSIDIGTVLNLNDYAKYMECGYKPIYMIKKEIDFLLHANSIDYNSIKRELCNKTEESGYKPAYMVKHEMNFLLHANNIDYNKIRKELHNTIVEYEKQNLKAYLFSNSVRGCGIIKDVSSNVVRIIDKKKVS